MATTDATAKPTKGTTEYPTIAISRKVRDLLRLSAALQGTSMREVAEKAILAAAKEDGSLALYRKQKKQ